MLSAINLSIILRLELKRATSACQRRTLYKMLFTIFFGVFLCTCLVAASFAVKVYSIIPPSFVITLGYIFDFLFALAEVSFRLISIVALFLWSLATQCLGSVFTIIPIVYKIASTLVSFLLWLSIHFVGGLLGLEEKAINTLSWLIIMCVAFLYLESAYQNFGPPFIANMYPNIATQHQGDNNVDDNNNGANPLVVADAELLREDQQLETENRENENEENAQEEADRNRVNNDNAQNTQHEINRVPDRAELALVAGDLTDDSSDDEVDPNICSVCFTRHRGAALFPCGHTQLCRECARFIFDSRRRCPICQTDIQEFRHIFV